MPREITVISKAGQEQSLKVSNDSGNTTVR